MTKSLTKEEQLKSIADVVRALVISTKPPCMLSQVLQEYFYVEGGRMPFAKLGYKNCLDLLNATNQFIITRLDNGQIHIAAKDNPLSSHVARLVRGQKPSSGPKKTATSNPSGAKALQPTSMQIIVEKNNKTATTAPKKTTAVKTSINGTVQQNKKTATTTGKKQKTTAVSNPSINSTVQQNNNYATITRGLHLEIENQRLREDNNNLKLQMKRQEDAFRRDIERLFHEHQERMHQQELRLREQAHVVDSLRRELADIIRKMDKNNNNAPNTNDSNEVGKNKKDLKSAKNQENKKPSGVQDGRQNVAAAVKENLQVQFLTSSKDANNGRVVTAVETERSLAPKSVRDRTDTCANAEINDPIEQLEKYCSDHGYGPPKYRCILMSSKKTAFQCQIEINGINHSTYPQNYPTHTAAGIACALKVLKHFQIQEARLKVTPCSFTQEELVDIIYTEVKRHPNGFFAKMVPIWFENEFKQTIVDHWWTLLQASNKFRTEFVMDNVIILFAVGEFDDGSQAIVEKLERSFALPADHITSLELPWSELEWSVTITSCKSTNEVWARLTDPSNIAVFNELQSTMEQAMKHGIAKPLFVQANQVYLTRMADCLHRVCIVEKNSAQEMAFCFFLDAGDTSWIPFKDLLLCPRAIRKIPKLAVKFKLHGLEEIASYSPASLVLKNHLPDSIYTARIVSNETQYLEHDIVEVELYEKSEISNFSTIFELIQKYLNAPKLDGKAVKSMRVTHISASGHLYLQIPEEKHEVDKFLQRIATSKLVPEPVDRNMKKNLLYLISDATLSGSMKWHRGVLAEKYAECHFASEKEVEIYFVDYGVTRNIPIGCIFKLEKLSKALTIIPYQALKTRLYDVPPLTGQLLSRLHALLPENCDVMVLQNDIGEVPLITVYYRVFNTDYLSNVNDILRLDYELRRDEQAQSTT